MDDQPFSDTGAGEAGKYRKWSEIWAAPLTDRYFLFGANNAFHQVPHQVRSVSLGSLWQFNSDQCAVIFIFHLW